MPQQTFQAGDIKTDRVKQGGGGGEGQDCHYDLDIGPTEFKIYRCLICFILYMCMKYEGPSLKTFWVFLLQQCVDRQTDGLTDKVINAGLLHHRWRVLHFVYLFTQTAGPLLLLRTLYCRPVSSEINDGICNYMYFVPYSGSIFKYVRLVRFCSCWNILSKLNLAPVNFHNRKCLAMKLILYTYKFK